MKYTINIINKCKKSYQERIIKKWKLIHCPQSKFSLIITPNRIELQDNYNPKTKNIWIDFNYNSMKLFQYDKNIKLIHAIGRREKNYQPTILDTTAGLARDAFMLFSHGYTVTMLERHPILSILIENGLKRGYKDKYIGELLKKKFKFIHGCNIKLQQLNIGYPDIIYIDPMFPKNKRRSLSKKNIRVIQALTQDDFHTEKILKQYQVFAKKKVIVKRPNYANFFENKKPNYIVKTKKHRFDVYLSTK